MQRRAQLVDLRGALGGACLLEAPTLALSSECGVLLAYAAWWLAWSVGLCWHVRGVPPYPMLQSAYEDGVGVWLPLYVGIIATGLACVVVERWL